MGALRAVAAAALLTLLAACSHLGGSRAADTPHTLYLVRHAEKAVDDPRDPSISPIGQLRAQRIALQLSDKDIRTIFVSDYKRTQQTAAPLASLLGITPRILPATPLKGDVYRLDPASIEPVRAAIYSTPPGNVLIVGHSNTLTSILEALGITRLERINDDDYGRLYIVDIRGHTARLIEIAQQTP